MSTDKTERARRKKEWEWTIKEAFAKFNINPALELMKMLRERRSPMDGVYRYKDKPVDEMTREELLVAVKDLLREGWLTSDQIIDIYTVLLKRHSPELKSVEVKGQVDNTHVIKLLTFNQPTQQLESARIITVPELPAPENDGNDAAV